jgi:molybdopterin converting factor small subunit
MNVRVVISGRSYDAAESVPEELSLPDGASVDDALEELARLLPEGRPLPSSCLVAVSGKHLGTLASHQPHALAEGDELVVIAPVAGG